MPTETRHRIGKARTLQTAVLVTGYLESRYPWIPKGVITYEFRTPCPDNGYWSAEIIVRCWPDVSWIKDTDKMVSECRAFVAGRGEVWA